jgi:hypothetical protein
MVVFIPLLVYILPRDAVKIPRRGIMSWSLVGFLLIMGLFSVMATRDYLSWNQASWDAANELVDSGVKPERIDGGHEFNGWHGTVFDKYGRWDPEDYDYLLAFRPLEGYEVIGTQPWTRLIPYGKEEIFVLRKAGRGHHFPSK